MPRATEPPEPELTLLNRQRERSIHRRGLLEFMRRLMREVPADSEAGLGLCLVSDRTMRKLNREFRGVDASTDVLAFVDDGEFADHSPYLGDIVISVTTAARQAGERGHSFVRELRILAMHGYLHLLGYDHDRDEGQMMRLQKRLVRKLLAARRPVSSVRRGVIRR